MASTDGAPSGPENYFSLFYEYKSTIESVLITFGLLGNVINLIVLRQYALQSMTFVYLFFLAMSDLGYLLVKSIDTLHYRYWIRLQFSYMYMFGLCHLSLTLSNAFSTISAYIVTIVTIERHRAICHPLSALGGAGRRRARLKIPCVVLLSLLIYVPQILQIELNNDMPLDIGTLSDGSDGSRTSLAPLADLADTSERTKYTCKIDDLTNVHWFRVYVIAREVISRMCPIALVLVLNVKIVLALRVHREERQHLGCSVTADRDQEDSRVSILLIALIVMFVACTFPMMLAYFLMTTSRMADPKFVIFAESADLLLVLNASCNFYLYCLCSAAVRKTFLDTAKAACLAATGRNFSSLCSLPLVARWRTKHVEVLAENRGRVTSTSTTIV